MRILKFSDFINEQSVYNTGVPLFRGTSFEPEKTIKRNQLISELKSLLTQVMNGTLSEITLVAEIPSQGKNAPQYLKDIYSQMGYDPSRDNEDQYDEENDTYLGNRDRTGDEPSTNIFVDSEFLVKDVDEARNVIIAVPYSLKKKNILVEITPEMVDECFIK
jgi:hypothetical protein